LDAQRIRWMLILETTMKRMALESSSEVSSVVKDSLHFVVLESSWRHHNTATTVREVRTRFT
jgi:hypothetical protein